MDAPTGQDMHWIVEQVHGHVVVRTHGRFSVADHLRMTEDVLGRSFWEPGLDVLFDHRDLDFHGVGYDAMSRAFQTHEANDERIGPGRAAILMNDAADYGVGRIFSALAEDRVAARLRVFTHEPEARQWLGWDQPGD